MSLTHSLTHTHTFLVTFLFHSQSQSKPNHKLPNWPTSWLSTLKISLSHSVLPLSLSKTKPFIYIFKPKPKLPNTPTQKREQHHQNTTLYIIKLTLPTILCVDCTIFPPSSPLPSILHRHRPSHSPMRRFCWQ